MSALTCRGMLDWLRRGSWGGGRGGAYGVGNLELLARAHVARLGDGRLQAAEGPVVQRLYANNTHISIRPFRSVHLPPSHPAAVSRCPTCALVTTISTSPRAALMSSVNLLTTEGSRPRRLFSARVARKFLTLASPSTRATLRSSPTMALLSAAVSCGVLRMAASLGSFSRTVPTEARARAVGSREEVLTAAVYCDVVNHAGGTG